jgi:RNA polymerase sigma-70 factor (ECF subfamily)
VKKTGPQFFPRLVSYQQISDEDLMKSYTQGDVHAFQELVSRHQIGVYNFLVRYLGQRENAEEAFQEVFVRVIKSSPSYTPQAKFSTWLYTIARNYCIDLSRKGRFRKTTSLSDETGGEGTLK